MQSGSSPNLCASSAHYVQCIASTLAAVHAYAHHSSIREDALRKQGSREDAFLMEQPQIASPIEPPLQLSNGP
eukprot:1144153-Pelagomonas_calceolata.AAC.1